MAAIFVFLVLAAVFVNSEEFRSAPLSVTHRKCGLYEIPSNCTTDVLACRRSCPSQGHIYRIACPEICLPGCECIEGYVVDQKSGFCVKEEYCPKPDGENESYQLCSAACQPTCYCEATRRYELNNKCICTRLCVGGYVCNQGYARNETGYCVPLNECPPTEHLN